jgi:hypothetical protein
MSLERSQEFFSVDWQAKSNLHVLPILFEIWALLGYYAECSGNFFPTFWDNLLVQSSKAKKSVS